MASNGDKVNVDSVLTFIFLKKLMTPIIKTSAYKLGLVDNLGRVIKKPDKNEESSLTLLDKFIFKIKRLLGNRLTNLHAFLYLQTLGSEDSFYNKLVVKGSVDSRAEIKRIKKDIGKIAEKYDCGVSDLMQLLINENLKDVETDGKLIV